MDSMTTQRAPTLGSPTRAYDWWCPGCPAEAVRWLVQSSARRVLDISAGTGKLSLASRAAGASVVAVELVQATAGVLRRVTPDVDVPSCSAGAPPLDDGAIDTVVVGQGVALVPSGPGTGQDPARRSYCPGGRLGLVWSTTVSHAGWVDALAALGSGHGQVDGVCGEQLPVGLPPDEPESEILTWAWEVTPERVAGCVGTHSGLIVMEPS